MLQDNGKSMIRGESSCGRYWVYWLEFDWNRVQLVVSIDVFGGKIAIMYVVAEWCVRQGWWCMGGYRWLSKQNPSTNNSKYWCRKHPRCFLVYAMYAWRLPAAQQRRFGRSFLGWLPDCPQALAPSSCCVRGKKIGSRSVRRCGRSSNRAHDLRHRFETTELSHASINSPFLIRF